MEYTIKRKEYREFLNGCIDKIYKGNMTWDEYRDMEVKFEPIDFTPYGSIRETTREMIEKLFFEEDTDRNGNYMLRGHTYHEIAEKEALNMNYGDGGNGYSWWAYNDSEMMIYTYCEGDTTLTLCTTKDIYEREKERSREFYTEQF